MKKRIALVMVIFAALLLLYPSAAQAMSITIHININDLVAGDTLVMEVEPTDRIEDVKGMIEAQTGLAQGLQILSFNGTEMEDGNTLQDYSVMRDNTLELSRLEFDVAQGRVVISESGATVTVEYGASQSRLLASDTPIIITQSNNTAPTANNIAVKNGTHDITLENVNICTGNHYGMLIGGIATEGSLDTIIFGNATVTLRLSGVNHIAANGYYGGAVPVGVTQTAALTIDADNETDNSLWADSYSDGKAAIGGAWDQWSCGDIAINGGAIYATARGNGTAVIGEGGSPIIASDAVLTINGGKVSASNQPGSGEKGIGGDQMSVVIGGGTLITPNSIVGQTITITGGSVNAERVSTAVTNGAVPVYKTALTVPDAGEKKVADVNVVQDDADIAYGFHDMYCDSLSGLYLWLPASGETVLETLGVDSAVYEGQNAFYGDVPTDSTGRLRMDQPEVSVTSVPALTEYGGTLFPGITGGAGSGAALYKYEGTAPTLYGPLADAPASIGTYTLTALKKGDDSYYDSNSASCAFAITPKRLVIVTPVVVKTYDGTASAFITPGEVSGILSGEDVTVFVKQALYDSADVSDHRSVAVSYRLIGADAPNYLPPLNALTQGVITPADNTLNIVCESIRQGETLAPKVMANTSGGEVTWHYAGREDTRYDSSFPPTDVGTYTAIATSAATQNYSSATAKADFEIITSYVAERLEDAATGIIAEGTAIHGRAALKIKKLMKNSAAYRALAALADDDETLILPYDISLAVDSETAPFFGGVTLRFPVGSAYNAKTLRVLHLLNGKAQIFSATVKDGVLSITVTHLSPFAVAIPAKTNAETTTEDLPAPTNEANDPAKSADEAETQDPAEPAKEIGTDRQEAVQEAADIETVETSVSFPLWAVVIVAAALVVGGILLVASRKKGR